MARKSLKEILDFVLCHQRVTKDDDQKTENQFYNEIAARLRSQQKKISEQQKLIASLRYRVPVESLPKKLRL
jgi:hypothetical protein